ncbi:alpha/beta hydrolase [Nostocoides australiense]|uniref:Hydrolase, alpha/beta domain protein n=1 Tax=Nostocoides australiense Ben110 TaxID=1193182 RepID=W6K1M3_9MICO|nr:alpha/beta hydrolase [Tetrasphaera australiensis]MCB1302481.1 alpha/beta hydrolase [Tetrasphaera sp.]CCH72194.1 Hydrolase, alpha/beta domain protein [Tetrasphaera australiensis Ben110]HPF79331.1 alpha/beta hydrolase [Tetrasphaera australiensis]HRW00131.1 alpha/beta hydrolase [Tetrasphaera sp.]
MPPAFTPTRAERAQKRAFEAMLAVPDRLRRRLDLHPHVVDGARLDPDTHVGLAIMTKLGEPELDQLPVPEARRQLALDSWMFAGKPARVATAADLTIPGPAGGIPARLYRPHPPAGSPPGLKPLGLLVYFHGGGWVLGDVDTHDPTCRLLCGLGHVAVLNVGYRLAPEHRFPAAVDDAVAAFRWAHEHAEQLGLDPERIAVGGDSAGGNLAAVVAQVTHREGGPMPAYQLLGVPVTQLGATTRSRELFGEGYFLTKANMDWYEANYLGPDGDPSDVRASPLLAHDLAGLPPAYVAVAGFDPLRDEGIAYAEKMRAAGVDVTVRVHEDAVHPMLTMPAAPLGQRVLAETAGALKTALG